MQVSNQLAPTPERLEEFFGAADDGPFVMVNLLKFRDRAEYADGRETEMTGAQAYALYGAGVRKCIQEAGGTPRFAGKVTGLLLGEVENMWDLVALVEFPSLRAFRAMIESPAYREILVHRDAGLEGQLDIRTQPGMSG